MKYAFPVLLAAIAAASAQNLSQWANMPLLQKSPVVLGARGDFGYTVGTKDSIDYGVSAELLFPLASTVRLRAQVLKLSILSGSSNVLTFNTELGLDALLGFPSGRYPVVPYVYAGGGFKATNQASAYGLRGGVGLEGKVARYARAFGELELDYTFAARGRTQIRAGAGVRLGS
jgi:hypothetical protein